MSANDNFYAAVEDAAQASGFNVPIAWALGILEDLESSRALKCTRPATHQQIVDVNAWVTKARSEHEEA